MIVLGHPNMMRCRYEDVDDHVLSSFRLDVDVRYVGTYIPTLDDEQKCHNTGLKCLSRTLSRACAKNIQQPQPPAGRLLVKNQN